jgi:hypothetical protein
MSRFTTIVSIFAAALLYTGCTDDSTPADASTDAADVSLVSDAVVDGSVDASDASVVDSSVEADVVSMDSSVVDSAVSTDASAKDAVADVAVDGSTSR